MKSFFSYIKLLIVSIILLNIGFNISSQEIITQYKPWVIWNWAGEAKTENEISSYLNEIKDMKIGGLKINIESDSFIKSANLNNYYNSFELLLSLAKENNILVDLPLLFNKYCSIKENENSSCAKMLHVVEISSLIPDTSIRASIDAELSVFDNILGVFAISDDYKEQIDVTWLIDKSNYTNFFKLGSGWKLHVIVSKNLVKKNPDEVYYEIDYFNDKELNNYSNNFNAFLNNIDDKSSFRALSNEENFLSNYKLNWTSNFLIEFRERRKYDLTPYFYTFIDGFESEFKYRIISDYYKTVSELWEEKYLQFQTTIANDNGLKFIGNVEDLPGNLFEMNKGSNIPFFDMLCFSNFNYPLLKKSDYFSQFPISDLSYFKYVASAANIANMQLLGCNVSNSASNKFELDLSSIKTQVDQLFVNGVNHIFYNDSTFSKSASYWNDLDELNDYIYNCQEILQSSVQDNEILIYCPVNDYWNMHLSGDKLNSFDKDDFMNWFSNSSSVELATKLSLAGYSYDFVSDNQILNFEYYGNKRYSDNNSYRLLIIPECNFIPLETLRKLLDLAEYGARIVFLNGLPKDVPGFCKYEIQRLKLLDFKYTLFVNPNISVIRDLSETAELDYLSKEELEYFEIKYIRKNYKKGKAYFITNFSDKKIDKWLSVSDKSPVCELYDPLTKKRGIASENSEGKVRIQINSKQSLFLFTNQKSYTENKWLYNNYQFMPHSIIGEWEVEIFNDSINSSLNAAMSDNSDEVNVEGYQSNNRKIKYSIKFNMPADYTLTDNHILTFTRIQKTAEITLNNKSLGKIWCLPNELVISPKMLKKKNNKLEVIVDDFKPENNNEKEGLHSGIFGEVLIMPLVNVKK